MAEFVCGASGAPNEFAAAILDAALVPDAACVFVRERGSDRRSQCNLIIGHPARLWVECALIYY